MEASEHSSIQTVIELAARIALGLVFLLYGLDKIASPDDFARAIANYRLLPGNLVNFVAVTLPWVECILGLLLLAGQWVRSAALVSAFLLCVFLTAVTLTLFRGLDINCGCLNAEAGRKVGIRLLVEDTLLLGAAGVLILKAGDRIGWRALLAR
jgi:uncharacterized membrane protein YphA (DoxX/SURF4 family)